MTHKMWWPITPLPYGNVGDTITPFLYEADTGKKPERGQRGGEGVIHGCGSIAAQAGPGSIVWGSGTMQKHDVPCADAIYTAVRGPNTRAQVLEAGGDCPEVYGDPALLLPRFVAGHSRQTFSAGVGFVPHYVDGERLRALNRSSYIVSPLMVVRDFVDWLTIHSHIASSSLHGIIIAHAYGIPACWIKFGDSVRGGDWKFKDYGLSVGLDLEPWEVHMEREPLSGEEVIKRAVLPKTMPDLDLLWEVRPWA